MYVDSGWLNPDLEYYAALKIRLNYMFDSGKISIITYVKNIKVWKSTWYAITCR